LGAVPKKPPLEVPVDELNAPPVVGVDPKKAMIALLKSKKPRPFGGRGFVYSLPLTLG
jgi:hypothetical protein